MDLRISFFLPALGGGGAEKCTLTLAKGLAKRNLEVSIILSKAEGALVKQVADAIQLVDLRSPSVKESIPRLIRYYQRSRPDVLISALDHANIAALIAKHISGVDLRVFVTTHTMVSLETRSSRRVRSQAIPALIRLLYPTADLVVAVSGAIASDLSEVAKLPLKSIRVIHNPVATREILELSHAPVNSTWFVQDAPPVVIAVGSLWPHKDHKTLIEALSLARRSRPLRLVILGEGPQRPLLSNLLKQLRLEEDVAMPGFVENPYSWMAKSAVCVLPSKWEGLPTVLVEAMACGVSPVATDCPGGSAEVLEGGKYGCLTPVGDSVAMAEAILDSIDRPFNPEALRKRAEDFSVDKAVRQYMELIKNPEA